MSISKKSRDRASMPSYLTEDDKNRCFPTTRGWEMRTLGNRNPASSEVLIAMRGLLGSTTGVADDPTVDTTDGVYETQTIVGVVGTPIIPVRFEVYDLEDTNAGIALSGSLPAGLISSAGSEGDYQWVISGTPSGATTTGINITATDGDGGTVVIPFNVNIVV